MARYGESIERKNLITLASTAGASVEGGYVARLHGDSEDIDTATFNHVRAALKRVGGVPNVRFVYLMTERAGKWVFLADAEDPSSKDYSPPGQVYTADTTTFHKVLTTGVAAVDGPSPDDWGVWVSGLAPILDPESGTPIAVFGMDIRADEMAHNGQSLPADRRGDCGAGVCSCRLVSCRSVSTRFSTSKR